MQKEKILVICYMGRNRSKYLATFLSSKGYDADFAGILSEGKNLVTQELIDCSDLIIFVLPRIKEKFLLQFEITNQKIITLNVEDRLEIICPQKVNPSKEEIQQVYETMVYPRLVEQILMYLPKISIDK